MRIVLLAALLAVSTPVFAADPSQVHTGQVLRDANNKRLGMIDEIFPDGTVGLILDEQYVHIPMSTIKVVDGKPVTNMTKNQLSTQ